VDVPEQLAQPIDLQKNISISYPSALAGQTIRLEAALVIDNNGLMLDVSKTTLRSSSSAIDTETLNDLARQIFRQWQFKPAQDNLNGKVLIPPQSNLIVDAEVALP
jgi:PhoPQ-activated pathogenicity-related protein